jgi:hypothetical protein
MAIVYSGDNITFGDGSIIAGVATQNNVYNVVTANANTAVGNSFVTFTSNTARINAGMIIYAAGFGRGVTVSSVVNANTILLSSAAANTATNTRISFVEPNRVMTADVAGPGLCKAWVNFNGTGTVAIRAAFNVSSITDNGTGLYTVNFTTAMPDANYCALCTGEHFPGVNYTNGATIRDGTRLTTSVQLNYFNNSGVVYDVVTAYAAIFR